jgi:hypothetical protein
MAGATAAAWVALASPFVPVDQAPCDRRCQTLECGQMIRAGRRYAELTAAGEVVADCACRLVDEDVVA